MNPAILTKTNGQRLGDAPRTGLAYRRSHFSTTCRDIVHIVLKCFSEETRAQTTKHPADARNLKSQGLFYLMS